MKTSCDEKMKAEFKGYFPRLRHKEIDDIWQSSMLSLATEIAESLDEAKHKAIKKLDDYPEAASDLILEASSVLSFVNFALAIESAVEREVFPIPSFLRKSKKRRIQELIDCYYTSGMNNSEPAQLLPQNVDRLRISKLEQKIKTLEAQIKWSILRSISLMLVILLSTVAIVLEILRNHSNSVTSVTIYVIANIVGFANLVVGTKYLNFLREQLNEKRLEYLAETNPRSCLKQIEEAKADETESAKIKMYATIMSILSGASCKLGEDFNIGLNGKLILTSKAYRSFQKRLSTSSAFERLVFESYVELRGK